MRTTTFFTALLIAFTAVYALPVEKQQIRDISSNNNDNIIELRDNVQLEVRGKHHSTRGEAMTSPKITYYSGKQLDNPACGGSNPTNQSKIAAVKQGGAFSCGDQILISHGGNSVTVKVVDYCESCSPHSLDLSPGAFSALANLDVGVITNAKMWMV